MRRVESSSTSASGARSEPQQIVLENRRKCLCRAKNFSPPAAAPQAGGAKRARAEPRRTHIERGRARGALPARCRAHAQRAHRPALDSNHA